MILGASHGTGTAKGGKFLKQGGSADSGTAAKTPKKVRDKLKGFTAAKAKADKKKGKRKRKGKR